MRSMISFILCIATFQLAIEFKFFENRVSEVFKTSRRRKLPTQIVCSLKNVSKRVKPPGGSNETDIIMEHLAPFSANQSFAILYLSKHLKGIGLSQKRIMLPINVRFFFCLA